MRLGRVGPIMCCGSASERCRLSTVIPRTTSTLRRGFMRHVNLSACRRPLGFLTPSSRQAALGKQGQRIDQLATAVATTFHLAPLQSLRRRSYRERGPPVNVSRENDPILAERRLSIISTLGPRSVQRVGIALVVAARDGALFTQCSCMRRCRTVRLQLNGSFSLYSVPLLHLAKV